MEGGPVCIAIFPHTNSTDAFSQTDATKGMIPRAVENVFRVAEDLQSKGWEYKMEGQFLEIVSKSWIDM